MAVHKVPQDVEAEDKFLGPLTFKQFLFFGGFAIFGYVTYWTIVNLWVLSPVFGIPTVVFFVLMVPWSKEQPTEVWLGARFRFLFIPHKRIWDQTGIKDLVKITVPKREAHIYSDGLSQTEVRKRFGALATMVDSRGWAIKSVPGLSPVVAQQQSDRLVDAPVQAPSQNNLISDNTLDVFDEDTGNIAQNFDTMIQASEQKHKSETQRLIEEARRAGPAGAQGAQTQATNQPGQTQAQQANQAQAQQAPTQEPQPQQAPSAPKTETERMIQEARQAKPASEAQQQPQTSAQQPNTKAPAQTSQDFWFMHQNNNQSGEKSSVGEPTNLATFTNTPVITPGKPSSSTTASQSTNDDVNDSLDEQAALQKIHDKEHRDSLQTKSRHETVIDPTSGKKAKSQGSQTADDTTDDTADKKDQKNHKQNVTTPVDPDILNLASNRDLNVATIAREAKRHDDDQDEVVISLH